MSIETGEVHTVYCAYFVQQFVPQTVRALINLTTKFINDRLRSKEEVQAFNCLHIYLYVSNEIKTILVASVSFPIVPRQSSVCILL